ncbi:MAG: hypothetical protein H6672_03520 [Anaerolineaceae bacterium]|nr:hypothetical protein [Anaerolineaceae bacterium]
MRQFIYGICLIWLVVTAVPLLAQEAPIPAATEEATPTEVEVSPTAPVSSDIPLLINARTDLELLANGVMGTGRPLGWSGGLDINDPQLALLIRLDLELLAGQVLGMNERPAGWFGAVPSTPEAIARDIRHDLELLADTVNSLGVRPPGWAGADALMRCSRGVQTLVNLLERGGVFALNVDVNAPDFCQRAEVQASVFAETNLLRLPQTSSATSAAGLSTGQGGAIVQPGQIQVSTGYTVAFLNRYGTEQVGVIPLNTRLTPIARSFAEFSRMTLVEGDGFRVFVDYRTTSLADVDFAVLPDINDMSVETFCEAEWCRAVVLTSGNPAARRSTTSSRSTGTGPGGRVYVPVENLITYYDGQDANGTTVARFQLCGQPTSAASMTCEPVTEVVAPDGSLLASVGSVNGIPQFRVPYGYTTTSPRSKSYYMVDMWIAQPGESGRPQ